MNKNSIIAMSFTVFILLSISNVSAQSLVVGLTWENNCTNSTHLFQRATYDFGGFEEINRTIFCSNGCENDLGKYGAGCVEQDYIITIIVIGGIFLLFFMFLALAKGRSR